MDRIKTAEEEWQLRARDIRDGKMKSMLTLLEERGYVNQIVGSVASPDHIQIACSSRLHFSRQRQDLDDLLTNRRVGVYAGIDPTAPSMHVGHMVPFMALAFMYIHGYSIHYLVSSAP